MKKIILISILCILIILEVTGCGEKNSMTKKMLLCKNQSEKYVFNFDENNNSKGIYYEKEFDFNYYYNKEELAELKENKQINNIIYENIIDCKNMEFACNASFKDDIIINKIYLKSEEEATKANLNKYYNINATDLRTRIITGTDTVCEEIDRTDKYILKDTVTDIRIGKDTYNSIDDLISNNNKLNYYKKYVFFEEDGKTGTIEFKENGICNISLKDFNSKSWNHVYCAENKDKRMGKTAYLDGNCKYTPVSEYSLDITYTAKYESYSYCEDNEDTKFAYVSENIVSTPNSLIKLQFDAQYENIQFLNGVWRRKNTTIGPVTYKRN